MLDPRSAKPLKHISCQSRMQWFCVNVSCLVQSNFANRGRQSVKGGVTQNHMFRKVGYGDLCHSWFWKRRKRTLFTTSTDRSDVASPNAVSRVRLTSMEYRPLIPVNYYRPGDCSDRLDVNEERTPASASGEKESQRISSRSSPAAERRPDRMASIWHRNNATTALSM
jgi:hypothetical protein